MLFRSLDRLLHNDVGRADVTRDAGYARGRTTDRRRVLQRGATAEQLLSGQTWASVTSLAEGTTRVAAMAPNSPNWDGLRQTAVIEWIDAQWFAPAPAIAASGTQHNLTTTVTRSTDGTPLVGWIVRYEIADGPPAQFVSYEGNAGVVADATTDSNGRATVTISPTTNAAGTTNIRIQIIRPASLDGSRAPLAVGNAQTSCTWSAPGLAAAIVGPQQVQAGQAATYHIEVTNPGDHPVRNVAVTHVLPPQMSYMGSDPTGQVFGNRVQWQFPVIDPGMIMAIDVTCRADSGGDVAHLINATSAEGLTAAAQAVTRIQQDGLSLRVTGPVTAQVGQTVTFEAAVTNASSQVLTGVAAADDLGPGLQHQTGVSRIEQGIGDMQPGETVIVPIVLTITQPGELCHNVTITSAGGQFASSRSCLSATVGPAIGSPQGPGLNPPQPPQPAYELQVQAPPSAVVGQIVQWNIIATNTGGVPLTNIKVGSTLDQALSHTFAEPGFGPIAGGIGWNIPQLPVGHQVTLRVQARCNTASQRACHRTSLDCDQLPTKSDESCVVIANQANRQPTETDAEADDSDAAAESARRSNWNLSSVASRPAEDEDGQPGDAADGPSHFKVTITPTRKNWLVGDAVNCLVEVHNDSHRADKEVQLRLHLPASLRMERLIDGPVYLHTSRPEEGIVKFESIREMRAGESLTFRIRLRSSQSGRQEFSASAESVWHRDAASAAAVLMVQ